jgi:circadian clock protein KaiC
MDLHQHVASGKVKIQQIAPAELCPGQFIDQLQKDVELGGAGVVVIDSLNGYLNAMPNERFLMVQMHEMLSYLHEKAVVSVLVMAQHRLVGAAVQSPVDVSYLADTLILLRFFEFGGAIKRAISVLKHRKGAHEDTIREFRLSADGIHVGPPLRNFQGVLTGLPMYSGDVTSLSERVDDK